MIQPIKSASDRSLIQFSVREHQFNTARRRQGYVLESQNDKISAWRLTHQSKMAAIFCCFIELLAGSLPELFTTFVVCRRDCNWLVVGLFHGSSFMKTLTSHLRYWTKFFSSVLFPRVSLAYQEFSLSHFPRLSSVILGSCLLIQGWLRVFFWRHGRIRLTLGLQRMRKYSCENLTGWGGGGVYSIKVHALILINTNLKGKIKISSWYLTVSLSNLFIHLM